jgi:hypothetical protein
MSLDLVMETWSEAIAASPKTLDMPLTVTALLERNEHSFEQALRGPTYTRDDQQLSPVKVGKFFKRHHGRVRRGASIVSAYDSHRKQQTWQLVGWEQLVLARTAASGPRTGERKASTGSPWATSESVSGDTGWSQRKPPPF